MILYNVLTKLLSSLIVLWDGLQISSHSVSVIFLMHYDSIIRVLISVLHHHLLLLLLLLLVLHVSLLDLLLLEPLVIWILGRICSCNLIVSFVRLYSLPSVLIWCNIVWQYAIILGLSTEILLWTHCYWLTLSMIDAWSLVLILILIFLRWHRCSTIGTWTCLRISIIFSIWLPINTIT